MMILWEMCLPAKKPGRAKGHRGQLGLGYGEEANVYGTQ
jgi:hypothetical protein